MEDGLPSPRLSAAYLKPAAFAAASCAATSPSGSKSTSAHAAAWADASAATCRRTCSAITREWSMAKPPMERMSIAVITHQTETVPASSRMVRWTKRNEIMAQISVSWLA